MDEQHIVEYSIAAGVIALLAITSGAIAFMMRRSRKWARNIFAHVLQVVVLCSLVLAIRQIVRLAAADYQLIEITPRVIDFVTTLVVILIIMRRLFMLINRIERTQIGTGGDVTSAHIISRVMKIATFVVIVLLFGEHFGIGLSGLLAFGGIGGIAIGMAGKDILSNFFSGIMLYFDRPFNIGDWISSPDRAIEGTVVEIGWRMTQILTFDNRPLYVPNYLFSSISVENPGRMTNRRINAVVGLRYQDAGKVALVVADVRTMLQQNDKIDQTQDLLVYFNAFADSSLNIMVYCFTKTTHWAEWLAIQQDVYLKIIDIVQKHGADFAFPSQTLYVENAGSVQRGA